MNGWIGSILRVNLTSMRITKEPLDKEIANRFIGGRGLSARILFDETKPGTDPLGADNKLILGAGPCNGTRVPGSSRLSLTAKSPMTNMYGTSSASGPIGAKLKYAGYDAVIVEGRASKPVYLWIDDDNVELRDARQLWGKTTQITRRILQRDVGHPDAGVICIGPAGENMVRFACVISYLGRAFGKCGMGAVMGSKKLKAIAVMGTKGVKVAHPKLLEEAAREMLRDWKSLEEGFRERLVYGMTTFQERTNALGIMATKNYQYGTFPEGEPLYAQHVMENHFLSNPKACFSCCAPCDKIHVITKGRFKGTWGIGIEAVGQWCWGNLMAVNDLEVAVRGSSLCDMYGVDCTEIGVLIPWVMECFEKGILTEKDMGGLRLEWGNGDAALKLLDMITYRQGIGDVLAEGVKRASEHVGKGTEKFAMHVKGSSIDTGDPRALKGWALGHAVASRGADHCMGMLLSELGMAKWDPSRGEVRDGQSVDPYSEENKAVMRKWAEEVYAILNCLHTCEYVYGYLPQIGFAAHEAKLYKVVTGLEMSDKDMMFIGERIVNLEHAYNIREGWFRKDDTLPERFLQETLPDGPAKGQVVNLEPMLSEYYSIRGWNNLGLPTKIKLLELGLEKAATELESMGKLG